jgi:hypothetical protein
MSFRPVKKVWPANANRLLTGPATEPVTPAELRLHLRESATGLPDAEAGVLIETARQFLEDQIGVALITQSWTLTMDSWPQGQSPWWEGTRQGAIGDLYSHIVSDIGPPRWPLASVTSITTYDDTDAPTEVVVANVFNVDTQSTPGRIALKNGATWPEAMRGINAISIVYVAGYGDATYTPAPMKRAVLQIAAGLYTHRGDCDGAMDATTKMLVNGYKKVRV